MPTTMLMTNYHNSLYYAAAVSFIAFHHHAGSFSHAFATSSVRTTITSSFYSTGSFCGRRYNINNDGPSSSMTAVFLNRFHDDSDFNDDEYDDDYHDDYLFDLDSAREQLEALVGAADVASPAEHELSSLQQQRSSASTMSNIRLVKEQVSSSVLSGGASIASSPSMVDVNEPPALSVDLPHRPPFTSIERERRLSEIKLLKNLLDADKNDDAVTDLWSLWFSERGSKAESMLQEADELMSSGNVRSQLTAEKLLRSLIEDYGVYFSEPLNRLATLYYQQGRLEEALALNKIVLTVKPWHFGALSHIVMVYEAMGDSMNARAWARFRLPAFSRVGSNKRRENWVERAVMDASRLYEQGEMSNAMTFGEPDSCWMEMQNNNDDNDAWQ
jgi:tetratricopeptide (TPR) repeat protein